MIDVTAAILVKNGRVLLARRSQDTRHPGKWEFPGGKMEDDENPESCLRREMEEEFGVKVKIEGFFCESVYAYDFGKIRLLAYRVSCDHEELHPLEHEEIKWVSPENLTDYDLLDADVPIAIKVSQEVASPPDDA